MNKRKATDADELSGKKQLSESEERYKNFIELSSEGIWRFEFEGNEGMDIDKLSEDMAELFFDKAILAECNDEMARMYGVKSRYDLMGLKLKDLMVEAKEENVEMLKAFMRNRFRLTDVESIEKDSKGNIKYFLNNLVGLIKDGKLYGAWGTQRDITDRKKSEDAVMSMNYELTKKNEQLVKVNNELDNFIYSVSHDLNAPLSNIEGLINVLKLNECYTQDEPKLMLDMMDVAIGKFKKTLKELTEITKVQVNSISEHHDEIVFEEILEEVKFSIKNLISDTNAEIKEDFSLCEKVAFKKISLQSILFNLVSNAIKYRHPDRKPEILIHCRKEGEFVILTVKDNGIGIPSDKTKDIFSMFKRLHTHVEGTGLGLYLVKRIVENAGGRIEVESDVDHGSTFKIFLKNA